MRRMNFSTCPPVSRSRCSPVKNGWHFEHTSRRRLGLVERVCQVLPQAQRTVASTYSGCMFARIVDPVSSLPCEEGRDGRGGTLHVSRVPPRHGVISCLGALGAPHG